MQTAIVQTTIAPLYPMPNEQAVLNDEMLYGMRAEIVETRDAFAFVRTPYRYEGWVPSACLCTEKHTVSTWLTGQLVSVGRPFVDVLSQPRVQSSICATVPRGGLLRMVAQNDAQWACVQLLSGEKGYVLASYLVPYHTTWRRTDEKILRHNICTAALSYLGAQYRWGGKTHAGIDCSGLASMAYLLNGIVIHRDSALKEGFPVRAIPYADAKAGDLLYFPGHIAVYLGGGRFVHATANEGGEGVVTASFLSQQKDYRTDLLQSLQTAGTVF